jgi:hypothetical protein
LTQNAGFSLVVYTVYLSIHALLINMVIIALDAQKHYLKVINSRRSNRPEKAA